MSEPKPPLPAKFFASFIYREKKFAEEALEELEKQNWNVEEISEEFPFSHTDYYCPEMGSPLKRFFAFFKGVRERDLLVPLKLLTNSIEKKLSVNGKRRVNIDPGYLTFENVILATGKNYTHRIYLGNGIYADLTLIFRKGGYIPLPWTYPDYAEEGIRNTFNKVREKYRMEINQKCRA